MAYTPQQYASALLEASRETHPKDVDVMLENLIELLKVNGDLEKYEAVIEHFELLTKDSETVAHVTVAKQEVMTKQLADHLNKVAGVKLKLETNVDPEIVGGVVIRMEDTLIDASVKGQLDKMKEELSN